jgi:hypothetical protein
MYRELAFQPEREQPMKRIISLMMIVFLCCALPMGAMAADRHGFITIGDFSDSTVSFGFEPEGTVLVYNNEVYAAPDYEEVWPGSDIYVPVYLWDDDFSSASDKDIKNNNVSLSWRSNFSERYIDDVTLVDGKKAKVDGLESGTYAKIEVNDEYSGSGTYLVQVDLALSVNRMSYPETLTTLQIGLVNREISIDRDSVYAAQSPTQFYAMRRYRGKATFDFGDRIMYNATVDKGTRYYLNLDRTADTEIEGRYPDAHLEFYNFLGDRDTFYDEGELKIPINRSRFTAKGESKPTVFVYRVNGTTLTSLDERSLSFDSKKNILTIHTDTLEQYLLSSQPLHKQVEGEDDDIIYTGYATDDVEEPATSTSTASSSRVSSYVQPPDTGGLPDDDEPPLPEKPTVTSTAATASTTINAANSSAENPETSDVPLAPIVVCGVFSAGLAIYGWRKGWQKRT